MGEHSMMDGMPMIGLADCITNYQHNHDDDKKEENHDITNYIQHVTNIFEPVMEKLTSTDTQNNNVPQMLTRAKQDTITLINDHDLHVCNYTSYGATAIKKMGYSPDAYVQMAMQLATYRLWGKQAATYEATQTRVFKHGRTETTRAVSPESFHFCDIMASPLATAEEKRLALQNAAQTHSNYTRLASKGHGVDRHLLGLSYMVQDDKKEMPDLFRHDLYIRSKTWRVSTSHLTHPKFDNWGYGEVVPHGVGLAYAIQKDSCVFNLTALKKHNWTQKLEYLLEDVLTEMKLLHPDKKDGLPKSKL